jgi:hypothetical protein
MPRQDLPERISTVKSLSICFLLVCLAGCSAPLKVALSEPPSLGVRHVLYVDTSSSTHPLDLSHRFYYLSGAIYNPHDVAFKDVVIHIEAFDLRGDVRGNDELRIGFIGPRRSESRLRECDPSLTVWDLRVVRVEGEAVTP